MEPGPSVSSAGVVHLAHTPSVESVVVDSVVGVAIAVVLFGLYYVLVLRRAGSQR